MTDDLIARARGPLPPHDAPCPLDYVENALRMATRIEQLQRERDAAIASCGENSVGWAFAELLVEAKERAERAEAEVQRLRELVPILEGLIGTPAQQEPQQKRIEPDRKLIDKLREAAQEYGSSFSMDGPDEASMRDVGFNFGSLFDPAADEIERLAAAPAQQEPPQQSAGKLPTSAEMAAMDDGKPVLGTPLQQSSPNWQPVSPRACIKPTHEAADAFWRYWKENGETHKHGYYESTWGAINAALACGYVAPHQSAEPVAEICEGTEVDGSGNLIHAREIDWYAEDIQHLPVGTKLYAAPPVNS